MAVILALQIDPFERPFGELNFLRCVTVLINTKGEGVFEAFTEHGFCFVEITAGILHLIGSCADDDAVNFNGRAGRRAGDRQGIGNRPRSKRQ